MDHLVKERLTGAVILVALIVLLVPELLSGPKPGHAPGATPTSSEEPPLRSYTINLADDSHTRTDTAPGNGPAMPQPSGPEQPGTPPSAGSPAPETPGESPERTPPPEPATQSPTSGRAAAKPKIPASGRPTSAGKPGGSAAKATGASAAGSAGGWVVQIGVFASRENAERLALDVKVKGLKASVSEVTSSGRKLYRVRVGPVPDRAGAQELQSRLKAAGRPAGTIVPPS